MGTVSNREMLVARWNELVNDPSLADVPYKIELNSEGTILMSPANNWHGTVQAWLAHFLREALPEGVVITECSVLTEAGVRVPDVAWCSAAFAAEQGTGTPFTRAPEICAEILSPSNSPAEMERKVQGFLAAGAKEIWLVREAEGVSFLGPTGRLERSAFVPEVRLPPSLFQA